MSEGVAPGALRRLAADIQASPPATSAPEHWPYPLPEVEMVARYGLRPLTPAEQAVFPGLRLVLQTFKARLDRPPAVMPVARPGWAFGELSRAVVWMAETYPRSYLVRMPGGATLLWPYHKMVWTAVSEDVAATTLDSARQDEQQRQWRRSLLSGLRRSLCLPGVP